MSLVSSTIIIRVYNSCDKESGIGSRASEDKPVSKSQVSMRDTVSSNTVDDFQDILPEVYLWLSYVHVLALPQR